MAHIRHAVKQDSWAIRRLVWRVLVNPTGLDWRRFVVAVDDQGNVLGCGQIKPHRDGSRELASIAVQPEFHGQGIGTAVIQRLLAENAPPLYLTCRAHLGSYYHRFGFETVALDEMPPYFKSIARMLHLFRRMIPKRWVGLLIMRWTG